MSFPSIVDSGSLTAEAPGRSGPFARGADRYLINVFFDEDAELYFLAAFKSSDGGQTWTEQDAGARPQIGARVYGSCQSTLDNSILTAYPDPFGSGYIVSTFSPAADSWSGLSADTTPPLFLDIEGLALLYRPADNTAVLILPGDELFTDSVNHILTSFAVYDLAGDSWSAWTNLDYQDYVNPVGTVTEWNQLPAGACVDSDGNIRVILAQIARLGPTPPVLTEIGFGVDDTFTVPDDCTSLNAECIGGGGGGGAVGPGGGGGGGGYDAVSGVAVLPGDAISITVGQGGAQGIDGTASICLGASAGGGQGGGQSTQDAPGTGGSGSATGGAGGTAVTAGGGGGSCANAQGNGGDGGDGDNPPFGGGAGGNATGDPNGFGGSGGNTAVPPTDGSDGQQPGGGGGGEGLATTPGTGNGAAGQVVLSYFGGRGAQNGRLWQQAILPDNSLGTLDLLPFEIPAATAFAAPIPPSLDCRGGAGYVALAITGVDGVTNESIAIGSGPNADPITFSFALIDAGNSGSGQDASPALALHGADIYCVFKSAPSPGAMTFNYSLNAGAAVELGAFTDPGCRILAEYFTQLEIAFGTATDASGTLSVAT